MSLPRVATVFDPRLKVFYERVAKRRGDQKAAVAVANKMLKIIWFMLTREEAYESVDEKRYAVKLKSLRVKIDCWCKVSLRCQVLLADFFHECSLALSLSF